MDIATVTALMQELKDREQGAKDAYTSEKSRAIFEDGYQMGINAALAVLTALLC